jgi:phosphoglycolate phosphatase
MTKRAYRALLYDLDGTLIDSTRDIRESVNHTLARFGRPALPLETVADYIGDGVAVLILRALVGRRVSPSGLARKNAEPRLDDLVRELPKGTDAGLLEEAVRVFRSHYGEHLLDHTTAYDGALETLRTFKERGMSQAVVTNKPAAFSETIVEGLGMSSYVDAVVGGDSTPLKKPAPDPVLAALALLAVAPEHALMVGDREGDVLAGRRAGCGTCRIRYDGSPESGEPRADLHIDDLRRLVDLVSPAR